MILGCCFGEACSVFAAGLISSGLTDVKGRTGFSTIVTCSGLHREEPVSSNGLIICAAGARSFRDRRPFCWLFDGSSSTSRPKTFAKSRRRPALA